MSRPTAKQFEEFRARIAEYKKEKHRPWPTWLEILGVLRAMGWRYTGKATNYARQD